MWCRQFSWAIEIDSPLVPATWKSHLI